MTRREDHDLVTGRGNFTADTLPDGSLHAVFVRSPHAHARILTIDRAQALAQSGVEHVFTHDDIRAARIGGIPGPAHLTDETGSRPIIPHWPALADGRVMHVGQPVVLVVAETAAAALDGAERIRVDYDPLPAVVSPRDATSEDAQRLWPEADGNRAIRWTFGDGDRVAEALASARYVVRTNVAQPRIAPVTLEPRAAIARYDAERTQYHLHVGCQGVSRLRTALCQVMRLRPEAIVVSCDHVGGAFGSKTPAYPEYPALLLAARASGRPVAWVSSRSEAFLSDNQGRDCEASGELALDERKRILGLRARATVNMGAFLTPAGAYTACVNFARSLAGMYVTPVLDVEVECVFTNTVPVGPFRGAGRPEGTALLEALMDAAARQTGTAPIAFRQANLVTKGQMPHKAANGHVLDSGDFAALFDVARRESDLDGVMGRIERSRLEGRLRGVGVAGFVEVAGGVPTEWAACRFNEDRTVTIDTGSQDSGQGHRTVFPRIFARQLGIAEEDITLGNRSSMSLLQGGGTIGSRSLVAAGGALVALAERIVETGREILSEMYAASLDKITYDEGVFRIVGSNVAVGLCDLANGSEEARRRLSMTVRADTALTFPNGCHVAEVEVDPDTGAVMLDRYCAVDDNGTVIDHAIVEGQMHGGIAQGAGHALLEQVIFDPHSGQMLNGSLLDYAVPRATDMPGLHAVSRPTRCQTNPLGAKGAGESGTTGALAAVTGAVRDALARAGAGEPEPPFTAERIWRALNGR